MYSFIDRLELEKYSLIIPRKPLNLKFDDGSKLYNFCYDLKKYLSEILQTSNLFDVNVITHIILPYCLDKRDQHFYSHLLLNTWLE